MRHDACMTEGAGLEDLIRRSELPDPCTFLFGVPREAPGILDDGGPQWTVAHWINCARRAGHTAAPVDDEGTQTTLTYCGDVDIDGLVYEVHRGPRRRILSIYGESAARFELEESVWVEPVVPDEIEHACPWCDDGPPATLRDVAKDEVNGVFIVTASEQPEGGGRCITFQIDAEGAVADDDTDGFDTYCVVLDPGQHTVYGGVSECVVDDGQLSIRFTEGAAHTLGQGRILRCELALDESQLATLRYGLRRTLDAGRPDARPARLEV
jgi:hypothetical protein